MFREPYRLREQFLRHVGQTSPSPLGLEIQRAEGVFLYTPEEKKYVDLVSGVSVSNVGHSNPEVADAVCEQARRHMHLMVYGEIIQKPQVEHAALLASRLPGNLDVVYYVNSGSEANEAAVKLAKRATGRTEIISCINSYHGSTHGALSLMGSEKFKNAFRPLLPDIRHIRFNSIEDLDFITAKTAAFIIEPVQGEGGVRIPEEGYLEAVRQKCTQTGTILIFDEIQTGFGRCGKLFAAEKWDVVPDIITLAKALGGGMPLGALAASAELMSMWQSNPVLGHITTFGGHPVSCAAALASLKILIREEWVANAERKGLLYKTILESHKAVKEIRQVGLLLAVDLGESRAAERILPLLIEEGVMSDWFLFDENSFRIAPPLSITDEEIIYSASLIAAALDRL
ncbi:MAG: aspartate aminotransferase family protein [Bacteroidales bacterium]|nr:aspartate aminotransferase family protein [Bacteroidales bacterium]MBP6453786.1 aspartate aminotransferase family protein [Bacteroidales bacterium]WRQ32654.1 aspartate aminotransferase family protein [Bacteroidales bacterium MB20-C3-3]